MFIRPEVLAHLRDHLAHRAGEKPAVRSNQEVRDWLFGPAEGGEGFLSDPVRVVSGSFGRAIQGEEAMALREMIGRALGVGALRQTATAAGPKEAFAPLNCDHALDPTCWY